MRTIRPKARSYSLEELLEQVTPENRHDEIDWGEPQGKELVRRGDVTERGELVWLRSRRRPDASRLEGGRRSCSPRPRSTAGSGWPSSALSRVRIKGYPFEVALQGVDGVSGVVLVDQLRSLDWRIRRAEPAGKAPAAVMTEVMAKLRPLLGA